jgi:hypothetical protein
MYHKNAPQLPPFDKALGASSGIDVRRSAFGRIRATSGQNDERPSYTGSR